MPVPVNSLKMVGAVAMFVTQAGTIDFVKITPIKGRYFRCKYGTYQLDYNKRISFEGTNMFIYDTKIPTPLSPEACKRIQVHLIAHNQFTLIRDVVALNHREYTQELGKSTMRFLGDVQKTDMASVLNLMNNALQSDKKLPLSSPISQSIVGFLSLFNMNSAPNLAFVFVDNAVMKIVPVELIRSPDGLAGRTRFGDLDLTYRRNKYTYERTSVYFTTLDTQPLDLNDFKVDSVDFTKNDDDQPEGEPELETEAIEPQAEEMVVVATEEQERVEPAKRRKQPEPEEDENIVIVADVDQDSSPEKKHMVLVGKPSIKKPRLSFMAGGNGKGKKEDIDLPSTIKPQDLGTPLTMNMAGMLSQFVSFDPSLLEEAYLEGKYAKNAVNAVSPPPKKKSFNMWFMVGIVIIGVIIFQTVGNPQISKAQTEAARQAAADRNERLELIRLQQLEEQRRIAELSNQTNTNPQPPPNDGGTEVIGGGQVIPPAGLIIPQIALGERP